MDIQKIEYELGFLYNAIEVDIDADGVYAVFLWDQYDQMKADTIMSYMYSVGLVDVDKWEDAADGTITIYGFFVAMEEYEENSMALESVDEDGESLIVEKKTVIKVNSKGKRRRKVVCGKGKKWDGTKCVLMSAGQKLKIKKGKIKARRTQKTKGASKKRRTRILKTKAMKRRRQQGLR